MTTMDSCSERALPGSFNLITSVRNTLFKSMWLVLSSSHIRETSWSNGSEQQEVKPIRRWKWRNETKSFWSELWCEGRVWTHGGILRLWCDPRSEPWPLITVTLCFSNMNKRRKKTRQQPQFFFSLFNKFTFISNIIRHFSESTGKTSFTVHGRLAKIRGHAETFVFHKII